MQLFYFKNFECHHKPDRIIFAKLDKIFEFIFDLEKANTLHEIDNDFDVQPNFFNSDYE